MSATNDSSVHQHQSVQVASKWRSESLTCTVRAETTVAELRVRLGQHLCLGGNCKLVFGKIKQPADGARLGDLAAALQVMVIGSRNDEIKIMLDAEQKQAEVDRLQAQEAETKGQDQQQVGANSNRNGDDDKEERVVWATHGPQVVRLDRRARPLVVSDRDVLRCGCCREEKAGLWFTGLEHDEQRYCEACHDFERETLRRDGDMDRAVRERMGPALARQVQVATTMEYKMANGQTASISREFLALLQRQGVNVDEWLQSLSTAADSNSASIPVPPPLSSTPLTSSSVSPPLPPNNATEPTISDVLSPPAQTSSRLADEPTPE